MSCGVLLMLFGCGVRSYPVNGTVKFADGKPLDGGTVVFEKIDEDVKKRKSVPAEIGTDGRFALEAPAGDYRVLLAPATPASGGPEGSARTWVFEQKYGSFDTSGLTFTVTSDAARNHCSITVTPSAQ